MNRMPRIMVFDHLDQYLFDIDYELVRDATYVDAINGEHSLTITTSQRLVKTNRLLIRDGMGEWHEYVVQGITELHDVTEYYCVWSLQYDLANTFVDDMYGCGYVPGHASVPQAARKALECALEGTERWGIGTITVATQASSSFYRRSGWEAMKTVIEKWGGELHATISVDGSGVSSREVDLLAHIGSSTATRRFDYGHDLKDIKRKTSDDSWPCRIVPLGKSRETDAGGYTRRPDISSVNGNVMWLEDSSVVDLVKVPKPGGGYEYPTVIILNDTYEAPSDLKAWAQEHITEYTRPQVSYEGSVVQFERAGMNAHGVALGDNVVAVDRMFCGEGLRIDARVVRIAGNLLDPTILDLTIGNSVDTLTNSLMGIARQISEITENLGNSQQFQATADYVSALVSRLNQAINAVGGYCYITEGEGFVTYDYPVSDPLVGAEATKVVELRGGNIRIADSRTAGGDWDWKTLIQSGHVAANLVTAVNVVAGFIGNASGGTYWDLDSGTLVIGSSSTIAGRSASDLIEAVDATVTGVDMEYAHNQSATVPPAEDSSSWSTTPPAWQDGYYIWQRTTTTNADGTTHSTPVMISGRDGETATTYELSSSARVVARKSDSAMTPPIVAFYGYKTTGSSVRQAYAGRFVVYTGATDANGQITWTHRYQSSADETYYSYTVPASLASNVMHIRCDLYKAGGTSTLLDRMTVPIIGNGNGISSTSITYGISSSASQEPSSYSSNMPYVTQGSWLWTKTRTTYTDGSYKDTITKSYAGTDGTSVTILGSYDTFAQLQQAHPTGSLGDSYIVAGDLYVWTGSAWENVGQIQGPAGASVTVGAIEYAETDGSAPSASDWSPAMPSTVEQGDWLWVRTTYSDGSEAVTKTYMGEDAKDGKSVIVSSVTKVGLVTTVTLQTVDADGVVVDTNTLTIEDGQDGRNGVAGAYGYVHTAWANSDDGESGFSTDDSAGKLYLGVYTDNTEADSDDPQDYNWSLIKGSNGSDAYTVVLTNESHTFAGGTSAAVAGSTTCGIIAYKGTARVAATIGAITGAPTGMTVTKNSNGTTSASITVNVTTSLTTKQGMLTIPITVDGNSFTRTFSWSLALKGATGATGAAGQNGAPGVGVSSIVEQYYLSTSPSAQTGGEWSSAQPEWQEGKYIWMRSVITWSDGVVEPTAAVLARAINVANQAAHNAQTTVNNYLRFSPSTGLEVGYEDYSSKVVVEGNGVQLYGEYDDRSIKTAKFVYIDRGYPTVYGRGPSLVMGDPDDYDYGPYCIACGGSAKNAFSISVGEGAYTEGLNCQAFGDGVQALENGAAAFGWESEASGFYSFAQGYQSEASGDYSFAQGYQSEASDDYSHAEGHATTASGSSSHAEGSATTASGSSSHAEGMRCEASGDYSHASGLFTRATRSCQFVCGEYNANSIANALFEVGSGSSDSDRRSCFVVTPNAVRMFTSSIQGTVYVNGSTVHSSDRRLKSHAAYIDRDEASEFVRKLKPAIYDLKADGTRHVGFYAQDVRDADVWDTETVIEGDGGLLSLDYTALIAPLVAYTQQLESRIDSLEKRIDTLTNGGSQ